MPNEEKRPYELVSDSSMKIIDLSKPHTDTLRFKLEKEIGNRSVVLQIVPPDAVTRYSYGGEHVKFFQVKLSDLTTLFEKKGELEYTCKGQMFTDFLDEAKERLGGLSVEPRNPDA